MHVSTLPALNFMSHCMLGKTFYVHTRNKELFCEKRSKPLAVKLQFPAYPYIATQALFHVCWWPECRTISAEIAAQSALELQQIFHRYRTISCRRYIFIFLLKLELNFSVSLWPYISSVQATSVWLSWLWWPYPTCADFWPTCCICYTGQGRLSTIFSIYCSWDDLQRCKRAKSHL